jgi:Grap2 and cyclin-D-interacting
MKSLRTTQDHLDTGLKALQNNNARTVLEELPTFDVLRKDFISVISLIHSHSTRLWIALGKQPPTPSAACATLDELSKHICSLYGCTLAFTQISGPTFIAEARAAATEVLLALQRLLQEYSSGGDGGDSMRKTAALNEVCESARNISLDDREAALKVWKQDGEVVKDAIKELNSLLKPIEDAGFSDGWDELLGEDVGITELSEENRVAAKKVRISAYLSLLVITST